jgi:predicted nucleic acid-binding protein
VTLVVDASVAVCWYLPHPSSERATELLQGAGPLLAPGLLQLELASVLLRAVRRGELTAREAERVTGELLPRAVTLVAAPPPATTVLAIATLHGGTVWDAVYVATAIGHHAALVTAHPPLAALARAAGVEARLLAPEPATGEAGR